MLHSPSRRTVLALLLVLGPAFAASAAAADWTRFRGPDGLGTAPGATVPVRWSESENVLWKAELPGAGASSPIVLGERIYLTCYSGFGVPGGRGGSIQDLRRHVVCLRLRDGGTVWAESVPSVLPEPERIREGHGYASNTPATDGERLYVFLGKTGVFAFDLDGKRLWHADVGAGTSGWGSAASPVLTEDTVIVNASVESTALIALDKATGRERWRAGGIKESWNTPIFAGAPGGKTELVLAIFGHVLGFDPASGERLWSCETDIRWYMVPSLVAHDGVVYGIGGRDGGGALAVRTGGRGDVTASHRLWCIGQGSNVPSPVYHDGHVYWVHEGGTAVCADARTGRIVYEEPLPRAGRVYASPVLAGGNLYVVSRGGRGYVLPARPAFELLATNELEGPGVFNAGPVVADNRLLVRADRYLYCIGEK
jgi:hypothetical protein